MRHIPWGLTGVCVRKLCDAGIKFYVRPGAVDNMADAGFRTAGICFGPDFLLQAQMAKKASCCCFRFCFLCILCRAHTGFKRSVYIYCPHQNRPCRNTGGRISGKSHRRKCNRSIFVGAVRPNNKKTEQNKNKIRHIKIPVFC